MRKDVRKFLFVGPEDERAPFFKEAQSRGLIHFIEPKPSAGISQHVLPEELQQFTRAIRVLRALPSSEQEENWTHLNAEAIASAILELHLRQETLEDEMRLISLEIARIQGFGEFSLDDLAFIEQSAQREIQFFVAKPDLFEGAVEPEGLIQVGFEQGLDYYIALNEKKTSYPKMVEIHMTVPLCDLKKKAAAALLEYRTHETELKGYARYNQFLHHALIDKLNQYHLNRAQGAVQSALDGVLFSIEGWVPETRVKEVEACVKGLKIYAEEVEIEPSDEVPTYLENTGVFRLGEDLVGIYDTPSATDKDPSSWVLFCFALFFAFIIGDAGYGLVYLGLALFLRYRFPDLKGLSKRVLNLFTLLCVGCVIWGTLMTSFFGMQIAPDNPLRKVSLLQWLVEKKADYHMRHQDGVYRDLVQKYPSLATAKDAHAFVSFVPSGSENVKAAAWSKISDHVMFELALFIGVVHLIFSMLRYSRRNLSHLGWAFFLVGAYLYFAYYLDTPTILNYVGGIDLVKGGKVGFQIMLGGIAFAWLASIYIHGWKGIFEIMTLIQVFADTLSYLRLYALGLAGAIVAGTINEIAAGLPLILSVLLIVVSHLINIVLSTMSGIIHGLRLNFLEWYHYSFEGGGKKFKPLEQIK